MRAQTVEFGEGEDQDTYTSQVEVKRMVPDTLWYPVKGREVKDTKGNKSYLI